MNFDDVKMGMRLQSNLGDTSQGRKGKITDIDASDRSFWIEWENYGTGRWVRECHTHLFHLLEEDKDTLPSIPLAVLVEKKKKQATAEEEKAEMMAFFARSSSPNNCVKCGAPHPCSHHPFAQRT